MRTYTKRLMRLRKTIVISAVITFLYANLFASNLVNPAVLIPPARLSVGASYDLGGYTIANRAVPALMNRIQGRLSYSPFSFLNFGIDAGASQMEVAGDTTPTDTFGIFHGGYGFSGGGHIKLGTPFFFNNIVCGIGIFQGSIFSSQNNSGTTYGGTDACGGLGLQFHVPSFGYVTVGSQVYLIMGKTTDFSGKQGSYSNVNNVRGWLAIDYFPPALPSSKNLFYVSFEMSVSPKARFNARAPVQEINFSVSIGSITPRLYGQDMTEEWQP
jgi:hypothetical protein